MTRPLNLLIHYAPEDLDWEGEGEETRKDLSVYFPDAGDQNLHDTREGSYVGAVPNAARDRHDELAAKVTRLEGVCARYNAYDSSGLAAQTSLRRRVGGLAMVKNALATITDAAGDDAALAPHLAGTYLWLDAVADALVTVADELNTLSADWGALRHRIGEVAWIYDMVLVEQTRLDCAPPADADRCAMLDDVMTSLVHFKVSLNEPFG